MSGWPAEGGSMRCISAARGAKHQAVRQRRGEQQVATGVQHGPAIWPPRADVLRRVHVRNRPKAWHGSACTSDHLQSAAGRSARFSKRRPGFDLTSRTRRETSTIVRKQGH